MDDRSNLALMFIHGRPIFHEKKKEENQIHVGICSWKLSKVSIKFTGQD